MPDLSPSTFDFTNASGIRTNKLALVALTKGDATYTDLNNQWGLADNSTELTAGRNGLAIVFEDALMGAAVTVVEGTATIGLGPAVGVATDEIVVSSNPGKLAQKVDLAAGQFYTSLGYISAISVLQWRPNVTGVVKA